MYFNFQLTIRILSLKNELIKKVVPHARQYTTIVAPPPLKNTHTKFVMHFLHDTQYARAFTFPVNMKIRIERNKWSGIYRLVIFDLKISFPQSPPKNLEGPRRSFRVLGLTILHQVPQIIAFVLPASYLVSAAKYKLCSARRYDRENTVARILSSVQVWKLKTRILVLFCHGWSK